MNKTRLHLLMIGTVWPEPRSSGAGTRTMELLQLFLDRGWRITFLTAAEKREHSADLPKEVDVGTLHLNDSGFDAQLQKLDPDAVVFDRFMTEEQYGWRVETICPKALRILDTVDLHSLREIRRAALKEGRSPRFSDWFCDIAMRELASICRSDLTLLISDAESRVLKHDLGLSRKLFQVLPFLVEPLTDEQQRRWTSLNQRHGFVTIGSFRHAPNVDSVHHLKEAIWPKIRKALPATEIRVYGADVTPAVQSLHHPKSGFLVCGRVEEARHTLGRARVCLAPIRFGAGQKGKLLDAMLAGTPSVTTGIGAEGMQGDLPWPGAVHDEVDAFVHEAVKLYENPSEWQSAQDRIAPLLRRRFNPEDYVPPFFQRLEELRGIPRQERPEQLIGSILRHHQHRSTEYLSRWIESKNKVLERSAP